MLSAEVPKTATYVDQCHCGSTVMFKNHEHLYHVKENNHGNKNKKTWSG
jgi:hypothetical protein